MSTSLRIKFEIQRETNDHDGYCSGDECAYESEMVTEIMTISRNDVPRGETLKVGDDVTMIRGWDKFIEHLELDAGLEMNVGSSYCENSEEAISRGIERHGFRLTVIKATVMEEEV